jgi:hypothetical protein
MIVGASPRARLTRHAVAIASRCKCVPGKGPDSARDAITGAVYRGAMKGDRIEAVVDTGQGTQTFEIAATRAGRRIEVNTSRGVVEVREVTRGGSTVRTGRFMANRLIALVEHPAADERGRVEISTSHRIQPKRGA